MKYKRYGFTLIELMVVLVMVGFLSTISVASYNDFMKKGRDSTRLVNVKNIAQIVKVDRASKNEGYYNLLKAQIVGIAQERAVKIPEPLGEKHYFYGYSAKKEDFFVAVCGENNEILAQGTIAGLKAVHSVDTEVACKTGEAPVKEQDIVDENASAEDLDSYTIYQLS